MGSKFSKKFERKFSKYAISNLSLYLVLCYAAGYLISFIFPTFLGYLTLDPFMIIKGQIWRLVTWIIVPPGSSNIFFVLITLMFYYSIGTQLERVWGTYKYNVYMFSGMLFTILGSIILCLYCVLVGMAAQVPGAMIGAPQMGMVYQLNNGAAISFGMFSTYYINMSIFLAYAATFPDMQVLLMFIIPIKVKWLGIVYGALLVFQCVTGGLVTWVIIGSSLLNFLVFFLTGRNMSHLSPKQIKRRHDFQKQTRPAGGLVTKHKCAVCGQSEKDDPTLEFRFCSKCYGNYEYCQHHLYTHQHVRPPHEAGRGDQL